MGTSTNGILFYGFCIEEESPEALRLQGMNEDGDYIGGEDDGDEDALWAKIFGIDPEDCSKIWAHKAKYPVTIGSHCSGDYPMFYIAIRESELTAHRGTPEKVKTLGARLGQTIAGLLQTLEHQTSEDVWLVPRFVLGIIWHA